MIKKSSAFILISVTCDQLFRAIWERIEKRDLPQSLREELEITRKSLEKNQSKTENKNKKSLA